MGKRNGRNNRGRQSKSASSNVAAAHNRNSSISIPKTYNIGAMGDEGPIEHLKVSNEAIHNEATPSNNSSITTPLLNGNSDENVSSIDDSFEDNQTETATVPNFNGPDNDMMETDDNNDDSSVINNRDLQEFMDVEQDDLETFTDDSLPRGLLNHGNTCYINASLQALYAIPALRKYFFNCYFRRLRLQSNTSTVDHLEQFFLQRHHPQTFDGETVSKTISIPLVAHIWNDFKLRRFQQQDAQEFLKYLFNHIHEEVKYIDTRADDDGSDSLIRRNRILFNETQALISMKQKRHRKYNERLHQFFTLSSKQSLPALDPATNKSIQTPLKYRSIISDIFSGKLKNTVHCLNCNNSSSRLETFQDLSIPISLLVKSNSSNSTAQGSKFLRERKTLFKSLCDSLRTGNIINIFEWVLVYAAFMFVIMEYSLTLITAGNYKLEDCLLRFFSQEVLTGDNMYQCDNCNRLTDCVKQLKIQSLPDILTIHLNRYQNTSGNIQKLTSCIEFPLTGLDTSHFLSEDCSTESALYDLVAVIAHSGAFMNSGHYICYALNEANQEWYLYDDHRVMRISTETLIDEISSVAYILFYRKSTSLTDTSEAEENFSFAQAAREVCLDLEEIHCCLYSDTKSRFDLIQDYFVINQHRIVGNRSYNPPIFINRDAVYLPRYWVNLFVNTENPGLFNNYEAFCQHGYIRQTEWLFFNKIVNQVIKPVGYLLYNLYGDVFCPCEISPAAQLPVCQTCLNILMRNELTCQQQSTKMDRFEDNEEVIQPISFFNGTVEIMLNIESFKNFDDLYSSGQQNGTMSGDLIAFNNAISSNNEEQRKYFIVPYLWFVQFRNFIHFKQLGKCNCPPDYRQMMARLEEALSVESLDKLDRLVPYTIKFNNTSIPKFPFLPLSALIRAGQRILRDLPVFSNDKVRNEMAVKVINSDFLNQIDFNFHYLDKPSIIDNWSLFGIKERILEHFEKNKDTLPTIDDSEESLTQLGKIVREILIEDAYGYHFEASSISKMPFEKEFNYYVVVVSETVWNSFKETFGYTLELHSMNDFNENQSFSLKLDHDSLDCFYKLHYKPWVAEQTHPK